MEGVRHSVTRSFRDPALEADYRLSAAREGRLHLRVGVAVAVTAWVATAASDAEVGRTVANTAHLLLLRMVAALAMMPVLASSWLPEDRFARLWQGITMFGVFVALGTIVLMSATIPEPARFDYQAGLIGFSIACVAGFALLPLRFIHALLVSLPLTVAYCAVLTIRFPFPPVMSATWLLLANLTGGAAGLLLEDSRRDVFLSRRLLASERARSEALLENVLPAAIIPRLNAGEHPIADQYADATVLFADIVGFTPLTERLGPARTVTVLNDLFREFDQIATRLGVEKIETIGDGYLAVGNAPTILAEHPKAVADMALALVEASARTRISKDDSVELRIGIHTGPILAGIIGETRFHYRVFGETVNVASRIQGHSQSGRILISETTFKRLSMERDFELQSNAEVELKGHGPMKTWWLSSRH